MGALFSRALPLVLFLTLCACQTTVPPMPRMNLAAPGWSVRQGQAVWRPRRGAPSVAGDLLLATNPDGRAFVQFSKSPISLAVAQKTRRAWQVEFPIQNRRYAGRGHPPARLIWLLLPGAASGRTPPRPWTWQQLTNGNWRLRNPRTGESLEGYFAS